MLELLVLALLGLVGLVGWRLLSPGLRRLQLEDTSPNGAWLWLTGFLLQVGIVEVLGPGRPAAAGGAAPPPDLVRVMSLQALAGVLAVGVMLVLVGWRERNARGLGLRAQRGPPALLVAASAWLLFFPFFCVASALNMLILDWLGAPDGLQHSLRLFLDQPAARGSALAWVSMTLVIPACEEVFFRGALFGGLRRLLHPGFAIALSALMFALAHDPVAWLPVFALGAFLAWLYERTGSLAAPILFHALHNALTLLVAARYPELIQ